MSAQDFDRGLENYSALIKKKKRVADLSAKEFDEVMLVFRRIVDETTARRSGVPLSYKSQEIEVAHREKIFIINGNKYQAKTSCFDFERGDKVIFLEGLPLGPCVTTQLLNLRNDTVCRIWCLPDSGLTKSKE